LEAIPVLAFFDFKNLIGFLPEGCNPVLETGSGIKSRVTKYPLFWKDTINV
jgi:hypothetical protein